MAGVRFSSIPRNLRVVSVLILTVVFGVGMVAAAESAPAAPPVPAYSPVPVDRYNAALGYSHPTHHSRHRHHKRHKPHHGVAKKALKGIQDIRFSLTATWQPYSYP